MIKPDLHKNQPEPLVVGKLPIKDQNQNIKSSVIQPTTKLIQKEIISNPYEICQKTTKFRGGFLAANIPGENRKEQLDYVAAVLQIPAANSLITPIFHQSNSWIIAHFPSQEKLNKCINKVKSQNTHEINMIALSNNNSKGQKNKGKVICKEETPIKSYDLTKSYRIMDIPGDFSNDRIKGALKPFGKVIELELIETKSNTGEKTIQITIEPLVHSKDLSNRWSIPLGSTMARIYPTGAPTNTLKDRSRYTARLYRIPQATSTVILMHSIKNLRPKTCYIPKCSRTGKERNFAIISFQTKEELDKACTLSARYNNFRLTWSKSRKHHIEILCNKETKFSQNNKYLQESIWENASTSSSTDNNKRSKVSRSNKEHKYTRGNNNTSLMDSSSTSRSSSYMCSAGPSGSKEGYKIITSQHKGKGKEIIDYNVQEANTMDKVIAMMTRIATRLEIIENNMGNIPNRS